MQKRRSRSGLRIKLLNVARSGIADLAGDPLQWRLIGIYPLLICLVLLTLAGAAAGIKLAETPSISQRVLPFSGGLLVGIALFWILPEIAQHQGWLGASAGLAIGFAHPTHVPVTRRQGTLERQDPGEVSDQLRAEVAGALEGKQRLNLAAGFFEDNRAAVAGGLLGRSSKPNHSLRRLRTAFWARPGVSFGKKDAA